MNSGLVGYVGTLCRGSYTVQIYSNTNQSIGQEVNGSRQCGLPDRRLGTYRLPLACQMSKPACTDAREGERADETRRGASERSRSPVFTSLVYKGQSKDVCNAIWYGSRG